MKFKWPPIKIFRRLWLILKCCRFRTCEKDMWTAEPVFSWLEDRLVVSSRAEYWRRMLVWMACCCKWTIDFPLQNREAPWHPGLHTANDLLVPWEGTQGAGVTAQGWQSERSLISSKKSEFRYRPVNPLFLQIRNGRGSILFQFYIL